MRCWQTDVSAKQEFRNALKGRRDAIPQEQRREWDVAIIKRIAASESFKNAQEILLYAPIGSEIDLFPLARAAQMQGKRIAFPRCDTDTTTLRFYYLESGVRLVRGAYGIPEPPDGAPLCQPTEHSLCILPALTFDLSGARLGYGKGYYDRFLATFPGAAVGAVYSSLLVRRVPTEPHDLPVSLIFTEIGVRRCKKEASAGQAAPKTDPLTAEADTRPNEKRSGVFPSFWKHAGKRSDTQKRSRMPIERRSAPDSDEPPGAEQAHALHAPPILVASTFVLLLLSRLIDTRLTTRNNEFLVVILLQLMIFALPAAVYAKLRGTHFSSRIRLSAPRLDQLWFSLCMLIVMITGALLCEILTGGIASLTGNFRLYDTFVARLNGGALETAYVVLAYCLLPAFCEELIFRAFLCAEYERFGVAVSITVSAVFFAMLHFSFALSPAYLLVGALLACAMYTTRSFFTAFLLHALFNLFCLFGQPYLSSFYVHAGSNDIFIFCVATLFLLFSAFAAGEARKQYHVYARKNADASYTAYLPMRELPRQLWHAVRSPACAVTAVIWLAVTIVNAVA